MRRFLILLVMLAILLPACGSTQTAGSPTPAYNQLGSWAGEGMKNTQSFHVTRDNWSVGWKAQSPYGSEQGYLGIMIYKSNGELVGMAANVMGDSQDSSEMKTGPGDYYLAINSGSTKWAVVVIEY